MTKIFVAASLIIGLGLGVITAGCGGNSSSSGGAGAPSNTSGSQAAITEVKASKSNAQAGENLTVSAVVSATSAASYSWRQVSGPTLQLSGVNSPTVAVSVPSGTSAGTATLEVTVTEPGQTGVTATTDVNIVDASAHAHQISFTVTDDPDPTAGDAIAAVLSRTDGNPRDTSRRIDLEITMVLKDGTRTPRENPLRVSIGVSGQNTVTLGQDTAQPQPQNIELKDLSGLTVTIKEGGGSPTHLLNEDLPIPVGAGATQSKTVSIP